MLATATNPVGNPDLTALPARAPYACNPARSRGRIIAEAPSRTRNDFQRDRDRIVHSSGFRRLAHKTQVFVPDEGDHYRTRLTHTIEVGQLARALARALGLDDDLAEAVALAHDLGHTPFGHIGEDVLGGLMRPWGGFDHNAQALRIVTKLERRYATFDGLNLTWETLEGLVKHNGPLRQPDGRPVACYARFGLPAALVEYDAAHDLDLARYPSAEAQAAALADDIAYNAHDLDDGLRSGLLAVGQLYEVDFLAALLAEIAERHPNLETPRLINEIVRRVITRFVEDAIAESGRRLQGLDDIEAVRGRGTPVIALSSGLVEADRGLKAFLFQNLYRHPTINRVREGAATVVADLFKRFMAEPSAMASDWAESVAALELGEDARRARLVSDYLAGMTDRYAVAEHRRLFDATPDLR